MENRKPAPLKALTGLRCFAAINIVLFHFSNPQWFGWLAPIVNAGYASVSYFILLSGFVMAYNYSERARAGQFDRIRYYKARFTRLYPIYILSLVLAWRTLPQEWVSHTHAMFWAGIGLAPLLLQGWVPEIATFLNTPAWTMSAESFYYVVFPWMAPWKKPKRVTGHIWKLGFVWLLGLIPGTLYIVLNPDGIPHPDRFSYGPWLQALKYTPIPHMASFTFGVLLAGLDAVMPRPGALRFWLGMAGFSGIFGILASGAMPYALLHDGLLMPFFGCIILGLAGENPLALVIGARPFVFVGEASYCLYLLHFNMWNLIHDTHVLDRFGLVRFDPWISYILLILMALFALHFIEKPVQRQLRKWMHATG
ncbi:MAG TPA: acyltransferase [Terracidiphilus sp.]|nr:acyltransferase [Terracidiphilus sp.]